MPEFELIRRHFTRATPGALLGIGDDAALIRAGKGNVLAVSSDMLVSGTHFLTDADPFLLGHKTLAVNLSDMAAMGAIPRWVTLSLALPEQNDEWLQQFSAGFFSLAQQYCVELVGGDTTRGPLVLSATIMGEVPLGQALRRNGAQPGDDIWVSGTLGDAALALAHLQSRIELNAGELVEYLPRLHQPSPRVDLGLALRGIANSAIDISDGLLADLGHILKASNLAAEIEFEQIPVSNVWGVSRNLPDSSGFCRMAVESALFQACVLSGGDDYELCFTAAAKQHDKILTISDDLKLALTRIGKVIPGVGCLVIDSSGQPIKVENAGYDHFR